MGRYLIIFTFYYYSVRAKYPVFLYDYHEKTGYLTVRSAGRRTPHGVVCSTLLLFFKLILIIIVTVGVVCSIL
jgi:hypothetical protein